MNLLEWIICIILMVPAYLLLYLAFYGFPPIPEDTDASDDERMTSIRSALDTSNAGVKRRKGKV